MTAIEPPPTWLLGRWRLAGADPALDFAPGVVMEFREGGRLVYHIEAAGQRLAVDLVYSVRGDLLETDNPDAPHRASARILHGAADTLLLDFSGARANFVRER